MVSMIFVEPVESRIYDSKYWSISPKDSPSPTGYALDDVL